MLHPTVCILVLFYQCIVLHGATDNEWNEVNIISSSITLPSGVYPRMSFTGQGPQYVTSLYDTPIFLVNNTDSPFKLRYYNKLKDGATELLHTHGQTPHFSLDGVPYISAPALSVNSSFSSSFPVFAGTYFIHSHQDFNHDMGVSIPLIVQSPPPSSYPLASLINKARDAIMFIEDFCPTTDDPVTFPNINTKCDNIKSVYDTLNKKWNTMSSSFNYNECQGGDLSGNGNNHGGHSSHSHHFRTKAMMMMGVKYKHYLVNHRTLSSPSTFKASPNEVIRLRMINGGSMMDYNITFSPTLSSVTTISVDGHFIKPLYQTTSLWLAVGQRIDVIITMPDTPGVFAIYATEEGDTPGLRGGFILYTTDTHTGTYSEQSDTVGGMGTVNGVKQEKQMEAWTGLSTKPIDRTYSIAITGQFGFNSINGVSYSVPPIATTYTPNPKPLLVRHGERVCINIVNRNMETHPMHLHGHVFQVVQINGVDMNGPMRDTVLVGGGCQSVKICFDAVNAGVHAFHCHMSFHMAAGLMTTVEYTNGTIPNAAATLFTSRSYGSLCFSLMVTAFLLLLHN